MVDKINDFLKGLFEKVFEDYFPISIIVIIIVYIVCTVLVLSIFN